MLPICLISWYDPLGKTFTVQDNMHSSKIGAPLDILAKLSLLFNLGDSS
jgi:hypothetical protein